ncbi:MAG: cytochrome C [Desulfobulbus propionicus]|nr:MAG: cytochrome C [Desulfobulbus propionicus]
MNYPVWELGAYGGGFLIALVAVTHVFVSHFAVGGGLWLVLTERKARREENEALLKYVKGHARFFLLLTMVFGGLSGVGIWWTIALLNPGATSTLIHTFVFGWASEWVCFAGEIIALLIYYYKFETMPARDHEVIGWFYFIFAWLSLFFINGIIGFMLTPGAWIETGNFWQGFFNESFFPSLIFRSALCFMIAGMFGLLTGAWQKDATLRQQVVRWSATWVWVPFVVLAAAACWYIKAMPEAQETMILERAREISPYLKSFLLCTPALLLLGLLSMLRLPQFAQRLLALGIIVIGFLHLGSFEFIREAGRRPWIIHGFMYSNAVTTAQAEQFKNGETSFLQTALWAENKHGTESNLLQAGKELFQLQCSACHSINGPLNDIVPLSHAFTQTGLEAQLLGQGKVAPYMPPFFGNREERRALSAYIMQEVQGHSAETPTLIKAKDLPIEIPPFDQDSSEYVLLAWNNLGMHCLSDADPWWVILPPANDLHAQLILRGDLPEIVTEGVEITFTVESGFEHPENEVKFWDHAKSNFGVDLEPGVGLAGHRVSGVMRLEEERMMFSAALVPVVPYQHGRYNPYPIYTIEARDKESGEVLARTRTVAPTASEMGCSKCHGGGWRVDGVAGFTDETSRRILAVHDKHSKTSLLAEAEKGNPHTCQSCHQDPVLGTEGNPELLNFPAAIHGWHANYMSGMGAEACALCHPSDPAGPTTCLRGGHANTLNCTHCHGTLEDHALSLLKKEQEAGKKGAARLMAHLQPRTVATADQIIGRTPWLNEPDCSSCHEGYERPDPETASAFNKWTADADELYRMSTDDTGMLQCEACHGSTHATYPARNKWFGRDRDTIQPLQYQGNRRPIGADGKCSVCHIENMEDSPHHGNMEKI